MRTALGFGLLALLVVACRTGDGPNSNPAPSASTQTATAPASAAPDAEAPAGPRPIRGVPKTDRELPSTSGQIAWENLEGQIKELARLSAKNPKDVPTLRMLASQTHLHGKVRGDLDEIAESIKMTTRYMEVEKLPDYYLERATRQQALHRFKEAKADLEEAKKLGANADAIAGVQAELDWNGGNYEPAMAYIRAQRQKRATYGTWLREGILDLETGDYGNADRAFEEAEDQIGDTSPFPVAQLDMTRGIQKQKQGQLDAALAFFREAVRRLPQHVGATEHLAETLHWLGKDEEATKIYEDLTKTSNDPEFMGALAALYREKGKTKEADALRAKAIARYDELIKKYPEAMYWHGAEFFMEEGKDPKRALELLKKNVDLRPNATSQTALARAYLANGLTKEAKETIDKAIVAPAEDAEKFWVASAVYKKAGDEEKSKALAKRALRMNPLIEKLALPTPTR